MSCEKCTQIYGGSEFTPCSMCQPKVHEYNIPVIELYRAVEGQYIMNMDGPIGLNDLAIVSAMDNYFEVDKKDRLELSTKVRLLAGEIIGIKRELSKNEN